MSTSSTSLPNPMDWGLSSQAAALLSREPEILRDVAASRQLPPLPPGYVPQVINVLFDDLPYIRVEFGTTTYLRNCRPDYQPALVEYRFDDETALFQVAGELVVNRLEGIAIVMLLTTPSP